MRRDLREADLRGADLRGARLASADLRDAELDGALLDGADATDADLRRTRGFGISAVGLRAEGARLDGGEWREASLEGARLTGVRAAGLRLDRARLAGASFVGASLPRAVLDDTDLDGADFGGARLVDVAFAGARGRPLLLDADLRGADLRRVALDAWLPERIVLVGARLRLADARSQRERLASLGWLPSRTTRVRLLAGDALRGVDGPARALRKWAGEAWARRLADQAAEIEEERRATEAGEAKAAARKAPRRRAVERVVAEGPAPAEREAGSDAAARLAQQLGARAREVTALGRVIFGGPGGQVLPAAEDGLDFQVEAASRDRVLHGADATRDDGARLAAMRERVATRRAAERRAARVRKEAGVAPAADAPDVLRDAALAAREAAVVARRSREADGARAAAEAWVNVDGVEPVSTGRVYGPAQAARVAAPWRVEDAEHPEALEGGEADDEGSSLGTPADLPSSSAFQVSFATPAVEAARAAAAAVTRQAVKAEATRQAVEAEAAAWISVDAGTDEVPVPDRRSVYDTAVEAPWLGAADAAAAPSDPALDAHAPLELAEPPDDLEPDEATNLSLVPVAASVRVEDMGALRRAREVAEAAAAAEAAAEAAVAVAAAAEAAEAAVAVAAAAEAEAEAEDGDDLPLPVPLEFSLPPPPPPAEPARSAAAVDAARPFWRVVVPAVIRPVGPLRRALRGAGVAFALFMWVVGRAGRFAGEQLRWVAQVAWRVFVAGFARGLPAAWRALAEEANAGADVPTAEESVEFRVEAVARERALARIGLRGALVARRAVALRHAGLALERAAIVRRAAEPSPALGRLAAAQVAAARARRDDTTRRAFAEAEAARWSETESSADAAPRVLAARLSAARLRHAEGQLHAEAERQENDAAKRLAAAERRAREEAERRARDEADSRLHDEADAAEIPLSQPESTGRLLGPRLAAARARRAEGAARASAAAAAARQGQDEAADAQRAYVEAAAARRALLAARARAVAPPSPPKPSVAPTRGPTRLPRAVTPARPSLAARASTIAASARRGITRLRGAAKQAPVVIGPGALLAGRRLDERDLGGADLRGADLRGASLVGTNLRGARLAGADLRDADLTDAVLAGADLTGARLEGACLDQAVLDNAVLDDARLMGARMVSTRGLAPGQRAALGALGADVGLDDDGRWVRIGSMAAAGSVVAVMALYLVVRFAGTTLDRAALEQAAAESQRQGDPGAAAEQFAALAGQTEDQGARVSYLLEAAAAAEESGDVEQAMDLLDEAAIAAASTGAEARVRLRRAATYRRVELPEAAATEYRSLLDELDLTPSEQAEALTGLALVRDDLDVIGEEDRLLTAAATDMERGALALALADGWAAAGRMDAARGVLERALDRIVSIEDAVPARLRLARLFAESGDTDGALLLFEELLLLPGDLGGEARLGASELRARRGDDAEAFALLDPLLARGDDDLAARARFAAATIAGRSGDTPRAIAWLEEILVMEDVEPRMADEGRILLARLLVRSDPEAAARLVEANPALREELLLGQARSLREAGKRMDARALWVQVAEDVNATEEARVDAELSLAELQVEEGDAEGALRRYERVMGAAAATAVRQRVVLGLCNALVRLGRLQDAEEQYDGLLASGPSPEVAAQANLGLARTAELRGQFEKATGRYIEIGRQEGPWAVEALDGLGQLRERSGDLAGAAEAWRLARGRALGEPERRTAIDISLARVLDAMGDPGAAAAYAMLLDANDATVRVAARIAVAEGLVGSDPERARAYYEEAVQEAEPGEARAAARAGWLRATVALGDVEGGLARIRAWLETETDAALRGELAVAATQALRSEGRLEVAVEIGETYAADGGFELGMHRAGALRELGRGADAATVLRALVAASAEDEVWRVETLGEASIEAGDLAAAATAYDRLENLPGGTAAASFGRARLARERGEYEAALALLSASDDARAPMERATVLEGLGKMDEAEIAWDRLALSPDLEQRSAGVLGIARVRLSRDDPAGALVELDALPVVADGFVLTAAQVRAEALLLLRRFDEAARVYGGLDRDAESRVVGALGLGEVALARDAAPAALVSFRQALEGTSDPYYRALALSGVTRALAESGNTSDARSTLARLRKEHPDRTDAIEAAEAVIAP